MKLLERNHIGPLLLKNRIAFSPITTGFGAIDGCFGQSEIDFATERAKGGAALIFTDAVATDRHHQLPVSSPLPYLDSDDQIGALSRFADAIHHHGAKVCIQLYHAGRQTSWHKSGGKLPLGPSAVSTRLLDRIPYPDSAAMTEVEIEQAIQGFVLSASRAKNAGFDAIDIGGGAGYLIQQFISPLTNRRSDKWGGSLERRLRFPVEIINRIRRIIGDTYPLIFDLCLNEYREGGISPDMGIEIAKILETHGIDAFRIHGVTLETYYHMFPTIGSPKGVNIPLGKALKRQLKNAKVMLGQQIHDPELAESALHEAAADVILLGRPLLADPYFPNKTRQRNTRAIRKCIACNHCVDCLAHARPIRCTVNPVVGFERDYGHLPKTDSPKTVLVVGAGPAGMESARVAAERGHRVILAEKSDSLGGLLNYAALTPGKEALRHIVEFYDDQLKSLSVDVRLNLEVHRETVSAIKPDVVVLATGSVPLKPPIPGMDSPYVMTAQEAIACHQSTMAGKSVLIIGGGSVGAEIAEMLALRDSRVTLIEMKDSIAADMGIFLALSLRDRLEKLPITVITGAKVLAIHDHGVRYANNDGEQEHHLAADHVVLATGYAANCALEDDLKDLVGELAVVGDCQTPRKIMDAIHEGFHAARLIT